MLIVVGVIYLTMCQPSYCVKTVLRPVYEANNERIGHAGNPMKANNKLNSNQMIQLHIQEQQARYNYEKMKRQEAQLVKPEQAKTAMDSYMKAYQDQHENYQKDQENKQLRHLTTSKRTQNNRNKRLYEPKVNADRGKTLTTMPVKPNLENRSPVISQRSYDTSPFVPMVSYSPQQYTVVQPKQDSYAYTSAVPSYGYQPKQYYLKSLNSLIGKQPQEQLQGLSQLLGGYNLSDEELKNYHLNLKASTIDVPVGYKNEASSTVSNNYQDHIPITEDNSEASKVVVIPAQIRVHHISPVQVAPVMTSASNYYKVEVGSNKVSGSQPESHSYVVQKSTSSHIPSYSISDHDNTVSNPQTHNIIY